MFSRQANSSLVCETKTFDVWFQTVFQENCVLSAPRCRCRFVDEDEVYCRYKVHSNKLIARRNLKSLTECVLVVGGTLSSTESTDVCELFDPCSMTWRRVSPMLEKRAGLGLVTVQQQRVYAFGGRNGDDCLSSAECLDPQTGTWTPMPNMARTKAFFASCELGGCVYACGGYGEKVLPILYSQTNI